MTAQAITEAPPMQTQAPAQSNTRAPARRQWKGIRFYLTTIWSGPQVNINAPKAVDHAAWARSFGRKIALPLMFLFSIGAVVKLTKDALQKDIGYIIAGDVTDLAKNSLSLVVILVVAGLVIGMDTLLVVKCVDWMDKRANGESFRAERNLVWFVSFVESVTFSMLLQSVENPAPIWLHNAPNPQGLTDWALILIRALGVPIVTTSLATLGDKVITEKERKGQLKAQADNAIAACLTEFTLQPSFATLPALFAYRVHLDDLSEAEEEAKNRKNEKLMEHFQRIMPGAIDMAAQTRIQQLEHDAEGKIQQAIQDAEGKIAGIMRGMLPWLMEVIEHQQWPAELLSYAPEYARIDPVKVLKQAGIKSTKASVTAQRAPSNSETLEGILADLGIKTEKKPDPKSRDLWVKTNAIDVISDGKCTGDEARKLARELSLKPDNSGDNYKIGLAYVVPVRRLIRELFKRTQLHSALLEWHNAQQKSGQEEENAA